MIRGLFLLGACLLSAGFCSERLNAQSSYWSAGTELIVGFAQFDSADRSISGRPRLSLFFHMNMLRNHDFGKHFGLAYGFAAKNIGFTRLNEHLYSNENPDNIPFYEKTKRRSWVLGVPVMIKIGNLDRNRFFFMGAEYDWLFHFKEKRWLNGNKQKRSTWFSEETQLFLPSVFAGFQVSRRTMVKFQYYLDDFLNRDYVLNTPNGFIKPYADYTSRLFYVSIQRNVVLNKKVRKKIKLNDRQARAFKVGLY